MTKDHIVKFGLTAFDWYKLKGGMSNMLQWAFTMDDLVNSGFTKDLLKNETLPIDFYVDVLHMNVFHILVSFSFTPDDFYYFYTVKDWDFRILLYKQTDYVSLNEKLQRFIDDLPLKIEAFTVTSRDPEHNLILCHAAEQVLGVHPFSTNKLYLPFHGNHHSLCFFFLF